MIDNDESQSYHRSATTELSQVSKELKLFNSRLPFPAPDPEGPISRERSKRNSGQGCSAQSAQMSIALGITFKLLIISVMDKHNSYSSEHVYTMKSVVVVIQSLLRSHNNPNESFGCIALHKLS